MLIFNIQNILVTLVRCWLPEFTTIVRQLVIRPSYVEIFHICNVDNFLFISEQWPGWGLMSFCGIRISVLDKADKVLLKFLGAIRQQIWRTDIDVVDHEIDRVKCVA